MALADGILAVLQACTLGASAFGCYTTYPLAKATQPMVLNLAFLALASCSVGFGCLGDLLSLLDNDNSMTEHGYYPRKMQNMFLYLAIVAGFPATGAAMWQLHYPGWFAEAHVALCVPMVIALLGVLDNRGLVAIGTDSVVIISGLSQMYIGYLTHNEWAIYASLVMWIILVVIQLRNEELRLYGITVAQILMFCMLAECLMVPLTIERMYLRPAKITTLIPKFDWKPWA